MRSLPKDLADVVAVHLVMAGRQLEEDPDGAYRYATEARKKASRVGVVREACGFAAYRSGHWAVALTELRAARRMSGSDAFLPIIADCERGMGKPEQALATVRSAKMAQLDLSARVEMRIMESSVRRDLGQYEAAVLALEGSDLRVRTPHPNAARLYYAYADALYDAGRPGEAGTWLARAAAADEAGETDAGERLASLDGVTIIDAAEEDEEVSAANTS